MQPKIRAGKVEGQVKKQGYVALADNNLTIFPSAGYVTITKNGNVGPIHLAAAGLGPDDGFTSYKAFVGDPPRTRWADYGRP